METLTEATLEAVYAELKIVLIDWIRTGETTPSGADLCRATMANSYEYGNLVGYDWPSVWTDSFDLDQAAIDAGRARLGLDPNCMACLISETMGVPEGGGLACCLLVYLERVAPMIESTPNLSLKVKPSRERDSGNTLLMKEFINDHLLIMGGANAASGLASMPFRYLGGDEIDRWPLEVDDEGSPVDIVEARTRTFGARKKHCWTSTPTLAGRSAIWSKFMESDQRRYNLPCPQCKHYQILSWDRMRYDPLDPLLPHRLSRAPVMICENCGEGMDEHAKGRWYREDLGKWIAEAPDSPIKGYHLSSLYAPLGWLSWTDIVLAYERAKDDPSRLRPWTNTVLAECWSDGAAVPDWSNLYRRRETYRPGTVPLGGVILTCGVDVQRDRLELEIVAWGRNLESWSVDYIVLPGDTSSIQADPAVPCVWRNLGLELSRTFTAANGTEVPISKVGIDSGDQTQVVYTWVRGQRDPRLMATKGRDSLTTALGIPVPQDVNVRGRKVLRGIRLWPVGVSVLKSELYGWLLQPPPLHPGDPAPRGFCHFPELPESYFLGLTAEELRRTELRGFSVWKWEKVRQRNEPLDCRVLARAAAAAAGVDRWPESEWAARVRALEGTAVPAVTEPDPVEPEAPSNAGPELQQAPEQRPATRTRGRSKSSGWLQGGSGRRGSGWLGR